MSSSLSFRSLLDSDMPCAPNFGNWYRRIKIVLDRIQYVISDPAPVKSAPLEHAAVNEAYQKYLNDRTTVRCILLAALNDEFGRRFEEAPPEVIVQKLKESFDAPDDVERYRISSTLFNVRMAEGTSITDHVLYMIGLIERLAKLGYPFPDQLGKDAILNSLPPSYMPFLDHYRMNPSACNYHELLGLLQTFEKDRRLLTGPVLYVEGSKALHSPFKKGIMKKRKKVSFQVQHDGPSQPRKEIIQSKAECFFCKKQGHWRRNCPAYCALLNPTGPGR